MACPSPTPPPLTTSSRRTRESHQLASHVGDLAPPRVRVVHLEDEAAALARHALRLLHVRQRAQILHVLVRLPLQLGRQRQPPLLLLRAPLQQLVDQRRPLLLLVVRVRRVVEVGSELQIRGHLPQRTRGHRGVHRLLATRQVPAIAPVHPLSLRRAAVVLGKKARGGCLTRADGCLTASSRNSTVADS
jgi:hypothetical protein